MNVGPELQKCQNLKDIVTIVKNMDIENLIVDPSLHGHQTR